VTFSVTYVIFKLSANVFSVHLVFKLVTLCVCVRLHVEDVRSVPGLKI
jgi:hypothetical protein